MAETLYRIAHVSDLHLTPDDDDARSEPKLFGALRGMNAAFRRIAKAQPVQQADLVLVTGDVTDRGQIGSWQVFRDIAENAGIRKKLLVVPGNHDFCCLTLRVFGSRQEWSRADMAKAQAGLQLCGQATKFPWAFQPNEHVVVFALNSNNLGNTSVVENAMGKLGYFQLKAFADLLYKYKDIGTKIVLLHHSPNIPLEQTARKRGQKPMNQLDRLLHEVPQDQRHGLLLLCQSHRVKVIAHGHLHAGEDRRVSNVRIIGAPASTEPAGSSGKLEFPTYAVERSGQGTICRVRWAQV